MVCFVILHYMTLEETSRCIDKLLTETEGEKEIVVVDNYSGDGSGRQLQEAYKNTSHVTILLQEENSGFARGNNAGYAYAVEQFHPDFVVVMNSDIEICQKDFIHRIAKIYERESYAVLGPDIFFTKIQGHQSPKRLSGVSYEELKQIHETYRKKCSSKVVVPLRCLLKKLGNLKKLVYADRARKGGIEHDRVYYDVPLHGSCFIFSRIFTQVRKQAFYPETFFYFESEILDYECRRDGLKTVYDPSVQVIHRQNVSTDKVYRSELKKVRFMNRCMYESTGAFLKLMEQEQEAKA